MKVKDFKKDIDMLFVLGIRNSELKNNPAIFCVKNKVIEMVNRFSNYNDDAIIDQRDFHTYEMTTYTEGGAKKNIQIYLLDSMVSIVSNYMTFRVAGVQGYQERFVSEYKYYYSDVYRTVMSEEGSSFVHNLDCEPHRCKSIPFFETAVYDEKGIMISKETKVKSSYDVYSSLATAPVGELLLKDGKDSRYIRLEREYLDVASIFINDYNDGIRYKTKYVLDSQNGLQEMIIVNYQYPKEVRINPVSLEYISDLLLKEKNPKAVEGLTKYMVGRDTYSYDSRTDKYFMYELEKSI